MHKKKVQIPIALYPLMETFFNHPSKRKILRAGRRTGKTISSLYYILQKMIQYSVDPRFNTDPYSIMYVDITYNSVKNYITSMVLPILNRYLKGRYKLILNPMPYIQIGNSILYFKTLGQVSTIYGTKNHLVVINECSIVLEASPDIISAVIEPTLIDTNGTLILVGTPVLNAFLNFKEFWSSCLDDEYDPDDNPTGWYLEKYSSHVNPYLPKDTLAAYEKKMDPETANVQLYAEFPNLSSVLFFYSFTDNMIGEGNTPTYARLSFDFNVCPLTCIFYSIEKGHMFVYDELIVDNSYINRFCDEIKKKTTNIISATGDASGRNRSALIDTNFYNEIQKELRIPPQNILTPKSNPDHLESYTAVNSYIFQGKLKIHPRCKALLHAIKNLRIENNKMDRTKGFDHITDCLRYAIHTHMSGTLGKGFTI